MRRSCVGGFMKELHALEVASYTALAFSLWDTLLTLQDEVAMIWSFTPLRLNLIKCLFLFCRYLGLVVQLCNSGVARFLHSQGPVDQFRCRLWLLWQAVITQTMLSAVDLILMLRVYAFYNRDYRIGWTLVGCLLAKIGVSASGAILNIPNQTFDEECMMTKVTNTTPIFAIVEITVQTVILGLTFSKQFLIIRDRWIRSPIASLVYRDGMISYIAIIAVLVSVLLNAKPEHLQATTHMIFPVFIALLSSVACRVIINMQRLARSNLLHCETSSIESTGELNTILDRIFTVEFDPEYSQAEEN